MDIFINVIITREVLELKKVSRSMKVKEIKSYVELKAGIPKHLQRLQYLDNEDLDDNNDLKHSSVVGRGTLKVNVWKTWLGLLDYIEREKIGNIFTEVANDTEKFQVALYVAVSWGRTNVVNALISTGFTVNGQTPLGRTALHAAAVLGNCDLVSYLIEKGADINVKDKEGKKALNVASQFGNKDVERQLFLCHWKERTDKIRPWKDNSPLMMHQLFDSGYPTWKRGEYSQMYMSSEFPPLNPSQRGATSLRGPSHHVSKKERRCMLGSSIHEREGNHSSSPNTSRRDRVEGKAQQNGKLPSLADAGGLTEGERKTPPKARFRKADTSSKPRSSSSSFAKSSSPKATNKEIVEEALYNSTVQDASKLRSGHDVHEDRSKPVPDVDTSKRKINLYEEWKYVPSFGKMLLESENSQNLLMKI